MRNPTLPRRALAAASLAAAVWACDRGEPAAPAARPESPASVSTEPGASDVAVIPPFDPSLPALKLEPPPVPEAQPPKARSAKPVIPPPERAKATPGATAKTESDHPPLDALFRAHYEPRGEPGLALAPSDPDKPAPKPPRALDRLGDSIRLERRGESIGPAGPRQGTAWETEAGVRIPVDKSISLEGGVRVETRDEPGLKQKQEARRTPKLGVEVRF